MELIQEMGVMVHGRAIRFAIKLALIALFETSFGCSDQRSLEPAPVAYRLFVAMNPTAPTWDGYILAVDCETDSIVDSLFQPGWRSQWGSISATSSPGMLVIPHEGTDRVLDTRSNTYVATLGARFPWIACLPEFGRIVGAGIDSTVVFEDTAYRVRSVISRSMLSCKRIARTSQVIGRALFNRSGGPPLGFMVVYDIARAQIVDSFTIDPLNDGSGFAFIDFEISPDGSRIYASGEDASGFWLLGFDLAEKRVLFKYPYPNGGGDAGVGSAFVTPNGREVWATWGANPFFVPWPQSVHIVNAFTGTLIDTIDVSNTTLGWPRSVSPTLIRFVPNQTKAYVSCGTNFTGAQPVIVVRTDTHQVAEILFPNGDRYPRQIVIGPSP